jgi:hypothetical protein
MNTRLFFSSRSRIESFAIFRLLENSLDAWAEV